MAEKYPMDTAPKDGSRIFIIMEDVLPFDGYWGGGGTIGWREWNSCALIEVGRMIGWLPVEPDKPVGAKWSTP